jgi:hypothetical protein
MRWTHLPKAGGIYDQSPDFIDGIEMIFAAKAKKARIDANKAKAEANEAKRKSRRN